MTHPTHLRIARTPLAGLTVGNGWSSCLNSSRPRPASLALHSSRRNASSSSPAAALKGLATNAERSTDLVQTRRGLIVNPPATTRPPPLNLPTRGPDTSKAGHLIATGKAYFTFYKTGMSHIGKNYKLSSAVDRNALQAREAGQTTADGAVELAASDSSDPVPPPPGSRAAVILRERLRHDLSRLPVFALILLFCGEFTPLVVMLLPRVVPLPCRIPRQVDKLDRLAEARRAASFAELEQQQQGKGSLATAVEDRHIGRSLSLLGGPVAGALLPSLILQRRVNMRLAFLAADDAILRANGGTGALVPDEVRLACKDRGIDVLGVEDGELKRLLGRWLDLLAGCDGETTLSRMRQLLVTRPQEWTRSF